MKTHLTPLCSNRLFTAMLWGLGVGWAMVEAINIGVGIAIGGGMALVMMQRRRQD